MSILNNDYIKKIKVKNSYVKIDEIIAWIDANTLKQGQNGKSDGEEEDSSSARNPADSLVGKRVVCFTSNSQLHCERLAFQSN